MAENARKWLIIGLVFVIVGVSAIFAGLKMIGSNQDEISGQVEMDESVQATNDETDETEPTEPDTELRELTAEDIEFFNMLDEAAAQEETQVNEEVYVQDDFETDQYDSAQEAADNQPQATSGKSMPKWRQIWSDVNITEEEKGRLRMGFMLQMQKWGAMSPEDQMAERMRMEDMRTRWESMSEDERDETSQRLRDRFEDWRHSGSIELPELTLD